MWGCSPEDSARTKPLYRTVYDLGGYETTTCPHKLLAMSFVRLAMRLYGEWKRGLLPREGGLSAQAALFREVMSTLQAHEDQASAWYDEKARTKGKTDDR